MVAIVGPTGSGKSELAVKLAQAFNGEIINADSRQLFRYLDIGTAKSYGDQPSGVPHHLIDIISPDQDFNLADYQKNAYQAVEQIQANNHLPFLVGGSGLYVWTVLEGWQIPNIAPNEEFRRSLELRANLEGGESLYRELREKDPGAAGQVDPRNVRRVIRALEICSAPVRAQAKSPAKRIPPYRMLVIGLTANREMLYRRIDARVDKMIEKGLIGEVQSVLSMGFTSDATGLNSVGYKETINYLKGELTLQEMIERIKVETHRLVRHQYNWFRLNDVRIHWLDLESDYLSEAKQLIISALKENKLDHGFY